ncbi:DUF4282 domain-containing protein [Demequina subtropica]|uniref:DUF4282 domain-containing protein n=1 Tax=Demequina subtropica TaxID=1638989 RepID=UPI00078522E5|nr:DUF4282 domain-containing protein [Demequina subtropica]
MTDQTPPPPYPSTPPASPPPSAGGFFAALFDFSFTRYATTSVIKVIYVLGTAFYALMLLVVIIAAFSQDVGTGIGALIVAPIGALISLALFRVGLEVLSAVIFIAETVRAYGRRDGVV